jgi:hypothetical protein
MMKTESALVPTPMSIRAVPFSSPSAMLGIPFSSIEREIAIPLRSSRNVRPDVPFRLRPISATGFPAPSTIVSDCATKLFGVSFALAAAMRPWPGP